jgi:hypothetical protein
MVSGICPIIFQSPKCSCIKKRFTDSVPGALEGAHTQQMQSLDSRDSKF